MNKLTGLATITSASALTLGLASIAGQANAGGPPGPPGERGERGPKDCKGVFEAPMADAEGQVAGSEGKVCSDGRYKVEIPDVAAGEYSVCFHFQEFFPGGLSLQISRRHRL